MRTRRSGVYGDGGLGDDLVNGLGGTDSCEAEAESACERDIPPPPKVRVPR